MEVKSVDENMFHVVLSPTEKTFAEEIASKAGCTVDKVLGDLMFSVLVNSHADLRLQEELAKHDFWWDR